MATTTSPKLLTADEFYDFCGIPENQDRLLELDRGEIVELNRPGIRHGVVCANIARILGNFVMTRGKGLVVCNDAGLLIERDPDTVFGPDVVLFQEQFDYNDLPIRYEERPPALAIEVLSPTDRPGRVAEKVSRLLKTGIALIWVVDPETCTVAVYRPDQPLAVFDGDAKLTGGDALPDLSISVDSLFGTPRNAP